MLIEVQKEKVMEREANFLNLQSKKASLYTHYAVDSKRETKLEENFELFCRAFNDHDEEAWFTIQTKYHSLVISWIRKTVSGISAFDAEDLMQATYSKFWRTLARNGTKFENRFAHLGCILKYLKQCALTSSMDFLRNKQRLNQIEDKLLSMAGSNDSYLWLNIKEECEVVVQVRQWVSTNIDDPIENLLLKLVFEYDLKPADIVREYPKQFPSAHHVSRVRERVLKRARRALGKTAVSN